MSEKRDYTTDRRSGRDRRRKNDPRYLAGRLDRRSGSERRSGKERRTGWLKIGRWHSVFPWKREDLTSYGFDGKDSLRGPPGDRFRDGDNAPHSTWDNEPGKTAPGVGRASPLEAKGIHE